MKYGLLPIIFISLALGFAPVLFANDAVTPGEFIVEPATFHNLGFEWKIEGDDNRNATVTVSFRLLGSSDWK